MNKGKYFWGCAFITTGLLLLNLKINLLYIDYAFIIKLYPLAIVLIGLSLISNNLISKVTASIWGIFISLYVFSLFIWFLNLTSRLNLSCSDITQNTAVYLPDKIKEAGFKLRLNTSDLIVKTNKDNYLSLKSNNSMNDINNLISFNDDSSFFYLYYSNKKLKIFDDKNIQFDLSSNFIWNFEWDIKLSNAEVNFSDLDFKKMLLKTFASSFEIYLDSSNLAKQEIYIEAKFSNIKIFIPRNILCNSNSYSIISNLDKNIKYDNNVQGFIDTLNFKINGFASNIEIISN